MTRAWPIPEGLRVLPNGSWQVGGQPVRHEASLRYLKAHLSFEDGPAVVDGDKRVPIAVEGPPFEVVRLDVDAGRGECRVLLDDGSQESLADGALGMSAATGRFECAVRGGRALAVLSRAAHQTLLEVVVQEGGVFFLEAGTRRIRIRT